MLTNPQLVPASEPSLEEYRDLAELRHQLRRFLHFSESAARAAGLEPQQHQLLLALKGLPEAQVPTVGTLAARLCVEHHTAVVLTQKLETLRLVRRLRGKLDKRNVFVELTGEGEAALAALSTLHKTQLRTLAPDMLSALCAVLDEPPWRAGLPI
jgi:DNA-binding MarR family transcriptional regulator